MLMNSNVHDMYKGLGLDWSMRSCRSYLDAPNQIMEVDLGPRLLKYISREQMMSDAVLQARIRDLSKRYDYAYVIPRPYTWPPQDNDGFELFREPPLGIVLARKIMAHRKFRRERLTRSV